MCVLMGCLEPPYFPKALLGLKPQRISDDCKAQGYVGEQWVSCRVVVAHNTVDDLPCFSFTAAHSALAFILWSFISSVFSSP